MAILGLSTKFSSSPVINTSKKSAEGVALRFFTTGDKNDSYGERYDSRTETLLTDGTTRPFLINHGYHVKFARKAVGMATYRKSDEGWLYNVDFFNNEAGDFAYQQLKNPDGGVPYATSSSAPENLILRQKTAEGIYLEQFPIVESSMTQMPSDSMNPSISYKTISENLNSKENDKIELALKYWGDYSRSLDVRDEIETILWYAGLRKEFINLEAIYEAALPLLEKIRTGDFKLDFTSNTSNTSNKSNLTEIQKEGIKLIYEAVLKTGAIEIAEKSSDNSKEFDAIILAKDKEILTLKSQIEKILPLAQNTVESLLN